MLDSIFFKQRICQKIDDTMVQYIKLWRDRALHRWHRTIVIALSHCKFCIYTHPVNSKFTIWQLYHIIAIDPIINCAIVNYMAFSGFQKVSEFNSHGYDKWVTICSTRSIKFLKNVFKYAYYSYLKFIETVCQVKLKILNIFLVHGPETGIEIFVLRNMIKLPLCVVQSSSSYIVYTPLTAYCTLPQSLILFIDREL